MLKFASEKDGHTLLSLQSLFHMMSCISGFSYCGSKLTEAHWTVCLHSQGYPVTEWGHLTGHEEKREPREKITQCELKPNLTSTTFFTCLCLLWMHSIHFKGKTRLSTYYTCIALYWATVWLLTATVSHSYPILSEYKHRLQWDIC